MRSALALLAALATSAAVLAAPGDITVNHELRDGADVPFSIMFQQDADLNGGGTSWPYSFSGTGSFQNPFSQGEDVGLLTMLGLYTLNDSGFTGDGVAILLNQTAAANAVEFEFEVFFPGYTEEEIISALEALRDSNGNQAEVDAAFEVLNPFVNSNWGNFATNGENGTFVGFSTGTNLGPGSWSQQPVPEPGLMIGAGLGLAALIARRRKKSA